MCNASRQTLKLLMKLWISFNLINKYQNCIKWLQRDLSFRYDFALCNSGFYSQSDQCVVRSPWSAAFLSMWFCYLLVILREDVPDWNIVGKFLSCICWLKQAQFPQVFWLWNCGGREIIGMIEFVSEIGLKHVSKYNILCDIFLRIIPLLVWKGALCIDILP